MRKQGHIQDEATSGDSDDSAINIFSQLYKQEANRIKSSENQPFQRKVKTQSKSNSVTNSKTNLQHHDSNSSSASDSSNTDSSSDNEIETVKTRSSGSGEPVQRKAKGRRLGAAPASSDSMGSESEDPEHNVQMTKESDNRQCSTKFVPKQFNSRIKDSQSASDTSDMSDSGNSRNSSDNEAEPKVDEMEQSPSKTTEGDNSDNQDSSAEEEEEVDMEKAEENEMTNLRKELADLPFEDLQKLKQKLGVKMYSQVMSGKSISAPGKKKVFKRENKNRPMEISSKKTVSRSRNVMSVKKSVIRDPRFDDLSGQFDEQYYRREYGFLDDVKQRDKNKLLGKLKKEKDPEKKKQIEYLVARMTNQEKADRGKQAKKQREKERRKKEQALITEGKKPFFLKKSEQKKLELAEHYKELQKTGKLDKYLSRKRKKMASKDKKKLPNRPQV